MTVTAQDVRGKLASFDRSEYDEVGQRALDGFLQDVADVEVFEACRELPPIKALLEKYARHIKSLEDLLVTKRKMDGLERENTMDKIELYRDFIRTFDVSGRYEQIMRSIDASLEK